MSFGPCRPRCCARIPPWSGSRQKLRPPPAPIPIRVTTPPRSTALARAPGTWPLVGRGRQLAALGDLLEQAVVAGPAFASLVGEPGIGKTRLASELIARARDAGFTVLAGRCSQDDGAPPLWPWVSVLSGLGSELPTSGPQEPEVTQFAAWEQIVQIVLNAAATRPVLLVFDDLHWADPASLRVLRMLAEGTTPGQLMVLTTWRAHPGPVGAHADLVEMLARRHALRLDLAGLTAAESAEIVQSVTHTEPTSGQAAALRERTEGNPFFLVEFARLAAERGDLARLLGEESAPTAVHDVLTRRLDRLPEQARTTLRTAAVLGRQFDLPLLAAAGGVAEDDLLDRLEPALAAGLVREDGIDRFSFAHALVRDSARSQLSVSRRSRVHARAAEWLQHRPGRETELARHWLAAGPAYANRAWRAGLAAAAAASRVHAHDQAAEQLGNALRAMDDDPAALPLDRYEMLMQLVDAYRWTADWPELVRTVEQAVQVAEQIGDIELVAQAAVSTTIGALWQSARHGGAHPEIIAALRRCLERLPAADHPTRCRVMLSLANELYYSASFAERHALVTEALAMAERLADERLLLDANQIAFAALWTSDTARERLGHATRSMELARRLGEEPAFVVSATLRTVVLGELGMVEEMWSALATARAEAERLRMPYGLIVLETLQVPWLAMAGRFAEAEARLPVIQRLDEQMSLEQSGDAHSGAVITLRLWQGRGAEIADLLGAMEAGPFPITATMVSCLLRAGRTADAEEYYRTHVVDLSGNDWFSRLNWAMAAHAALAMGDREVAAQAYAKLAPLAGQNCSAGSGNSMGPADGFLALAAAAVGEKALAARHADRALELMAAWAIPLAAQWLRDQRERYGF